MADTKTHAYEVEVSWTGNLGSGTTSYRAYSRDHVVAFAGKPPLPGSADPAFRGDPARYNPEELLVGSLSACQMLWYLHLCAEAGIVVIDYRDRATGRMEEKRGDAGRFVEVTLTPVVSIAEGGDPALAERLHAAAHEKCFIANSVNFPVVCRPVIEVVQLRQVPASPA